jgi:hypothetical protein
MSQSLITSGTTLATQITDDDLNRYLGSTLQGNQLSKRILALQDPSAYATSLADEVKNAEKAGQEEYKRVFEAYYKAGLDPETCKALAIQASKRSYETAMDATRVLFPESQQGIYTLGAKLASVSNNPMLGMARTQDLIGKQ